MPCQTPAQCYDLFSVLSTVDDLPLADSSASALINDNNVRLGAVRGLCTTIWNLHY